MSKKIGSLVLIIGAMFFATKATFANCSNELAQRFIGSFRTKNCKAFNSYVLYGYGEAAKISLKGSILEVDIYGEVSHDASGVTATFYFDLEDARFSESRQQITNPETNNSLRFFENGTIRFYKQGPLNGARETCDFVPI